TLDVNLADGDVAAYVDGILRDKLPISPSEGTDPTLFRLSYDGDGPGNVATVLLDEVGVEVLNPVPMFREVHAAASASGATVWWSFYAGDSIDGFKLCRHSGSEIDDVVISGDALLGADVRRFEDNDLESGETYYYRVVAVRSDGTEIQSGTATVKSTEIWPDNRPAPYALTHGHPNPFSTSTSFEYTLAETGPVTVRVYDVRGALVSTLENAVRAGGVHAISWDGRDNRGNRVSGGTYFVELRTPKAVLTRKIVLVR
ncbi:MAG: FlgD immunoglobulin-like domain containing protein, partial [Candidatus Latescibacterota bacterium]